ncbi:MAG: TIGR03915 family putative DNA repair protein [Lachnospiraceae bacterium]|nr:TIGR03915 family putative DNA repair protein [Lachnospiraceae bacterium]
MYIYTCNPDYESMLTCIYEAWASGMGHSNVKLCVEPVEQFRLFDKYIHVDAEEEKAESVSRSIWHKISPQVYWEISYALLSFEEDALDTAYRVLILGFHFGARVLDMVQYREVIRFREIRKLVSREVHSFREFLRFYCVNETVYVAHFEPRSRVLMPVASYFTERMPSEHWMIIDDVHREAIVHPKDAECYLRILSEEEVLALADTEQEDVYTKLWRNYFHTMGIAQRKNPNCQMNHFPLWMRKHVTEFRNPDE